MWEDEGEEEGGVIRDRPRSLLEERGAAITAPRQGWRGGGIFSMLFYSSLPFVPSPLVARTHFQRKLGESSSSLRRECEAEVDLHTANLSRPLTAALCT